MLGDLKGFFEDLGFQRLFAQQSLQFPDLLLRPVLRRWHHFFAGTRRGQSTLTR